MISIDTGYGLALRAKAYVSAFCPKLQGKLLDFGIARVMSPGKDILDENSRLEIRSSFLFDYLHKVEADSIAGMGTYVPQIANDVATKIRMSSTGEVIISDAWGGGFFFIDGDNGLIVSARTSTELNIPFGSILASVVGGSDGIIQVNIHEPGLQTKIESGDAFYVNEDVEISIAYNPMGISDFPVLPTFGGSGSA